MFLSPDEAGEIVGSGSGIMPFIALLIGIANIIWAWHSRNQSASEGRVQKAEARIDAVALRLDAVEDKQITVEERLKHLPTKDDISQIAVSMERVLGTVGRQDSQITAMTRSVNRIEDYMREKA